MENYKQYLVPDNDGYRVAVQDVGLPIAEDWIVIPEGAEILAETANGLVFYKKHGDRFAYCFAGETEWGGTFTNPYDELGAFVTGFVWQRATHPEELPFIDDEPKYTDDEVKYMDENGQGRLQSINEQYAEIEQVRQVEIHGTVKAEPDFNFGAAQASGGAKMRENNHYFIDVSDVDEVDFYEIAKRYNVADPAIQHILKKCLAIGNRGHKDLETDLKDILKTAKRALQINGFGE